MIVYWLVMFKYKVSVLQKWLTQKIAISVFWLFRNAHPTKTTVELPGRGNPNIGKSLVDGVLVFAGVAFEIDVDSPWLIEAPSKEVELYLHGFSWLNDLSAYGNSKARKLALKWVGQWNSNNKFGKRTGWDADTTALRSINFLRNLDFLKFGSAVIDPICFTTLRRQYFFLSVTVNNFGPGIKKLSILYAMFLLAKAYGFSRRRQQKILKRFCKVLMRFVDLEGQILNRNPEVLLECFIMINEILNMPKASLKYTQQNFEILKKRKQLITPVLRGLRLGNGLLTRSHGGDTSSLDLIDRYLTDSDVKTKPLSVKLLGFERITAGRLILIVDCAVPAYGIIGDNSHASCLSFELSSGQRPIFVNCGPGGRFGNAFKHFCRSTQAHNSCTLGDYSQSQFKFISKEKQWSKEVICNGPKSVCVDRYKTMEATWLDLSQDCYEKEYGYLHYRKLLVLNSGRVFTGTDVFEFSQRKKNQVKKVDNFYSYFHLHPEVEVWDHPRLQTIILRLKNGEHWIFEIDLGQVNVEESTFINSFKAYPENTKRIVIKSSTLLNKTQVKWSLRRREIVSRHTRDSEISQ